MVFKTGPTQYTGSHRDTTWFMEKERQEKGKKANHLHRQMFNGLTYKKWMDEFPHFSESHLPLSISVMRADALHSLISQWLDLVYGLRLSLRYSTSNNECNEMKSGDFESTIRFDLHFETISIFTSNAEPTFYNEGIMVKISVKNKKPDKYK
jgi:hypothetical protein